MKKTALLSLFIAVFCAGAFAQKNQKATTAYAITGVEQGSQRWTEVRLVNVNTGDVVQTIYETGKEATLLNARTGKPIVKQDAASTQVATKPVKFDATLQNGDVVVITRDANNAVVIRQQGANGGSNFVSTRRIMCRSVQRDKPFATKSAACAYDKKHDRLYYTPMGINQLRYIDLKSGDSKIYYFEDEAFGTVSGEFDLPNQITRMTFASDGNGYALSNDGNHLIRFTTSKKAEITDLGALQDANENSENSVHNRRGYGGDMVADDKDNLYLITAHRAVFRISIQDMKATYLGSIQGLPQGFTTNGAAVINETTVAISSAISSEGYYKFDLKTLQAEKVSSANSVYNASDLANANLIKDKKVRDEPKQQPAIAAAEDKGKAGETSPELNVRYKLSAYPNPATKGDALYLRFNDFPFGRYHVQLTDMSGKLITTQSMNIGGKMQLQLLQLPKTLSQGTYIVKVTGDANIEKVLATEQVVVQ